MQPALSFHAQLVEEVEWYERVCRRDFETIHTLNAIGRLLIAARIANGLTQQGLAERLGVSAAQVSRDERNDYHGHHGRACTADPGSSRGEADRATR